MAVVILTLESPAAVLLAGAVSSDRASAAAGLAALQAPLPSPLVVQLATGDLARAATLVHDLATPSTSAVAQVLFRAGEAAKVVRAEHGPGRVIYWGGNRDASDWTSRGFWQHVFQQLLVDEFAEDVPWLDVSPAAATVTSSVNAVVHVSGSGLGEGDYAAVLLARGDFNGAEFRAVPVQVTVAPPRFLAKSTTGVEDWLGRPLPGNGSITSPVFQVIHAGSNGTIDPPAADGAPGGDDQVLAVYPEDVSVGRIGAGYEFSPGEGRFAETFSHNMTTALLQRAVYVRAWDGPTFEASVAYGDSALYAMQLVPDEQHDFGTWTVNHVPGYPDGLAASQDLNGNCLPDGWEILNGLNAQQPVTALAPTSSQLEAYGSFGTGGSGLNFPARMFLTGKFLFVLDSKNNAMKVWNRTNGTYVLSYGGVGSAAGKFSQPLGLGKDPRGNRFAVADTGNNRIQIFTFDGDTGAITFERQVGAYGTGAGQFYSPNAVAIGPIGRLHVADSGNHRIQVLDDATGAFILQFGAYGLGVGQFRTPRGLCVDSLGIVVVADTENNRLQAFNGAGLALWQLGSIGTNASEFAKPRGVQVAADGRIFVADTDNHRIQLFSATRTHIASFGGLGSAPGQLRFPYDLMPVDGADEMYVVDTWNHRIVRMQYRVDADGDGMDDQWEAEHGLNPADPSDAWADSDGDGICNVGEFQAGTDPQNSDSDGDGVPDGKEMGAGGNPGALDAGMIWMTRIAQAPLAVRWTVEAGGVYQLQSTTNPVAGASWTNLPGVVVTAGVDGAIGYTNAPASGTPSFLRAVQINAP